MRVQMTRVQANEGAVDEDKVRLHQIEVSKSCGKTSFDRLLEKLKCCLRRKGWNN